MSILGVTIDYGPFGWIDNFDKGHICNHSDKGGRYSYENQPKIFEWNLIKLAEAWKPCVPFEKTSEFTKKNFDGLFKEFYYNKMREKVAFSSTILVILTITTSSVFSGLSRLRILL